MSTNKPPFPDVDIFNNLYWISANKSITTAEADLRYLKFPSAQGDETLRNININGIASINAGTNSLILNSNATSLLYNPCVIAGTQLLASIGTINTETLTLTTQSSISNGIIIDANNVNFPSTNAPTSNQTMLLSSDNSNKIATTSWSQSLVSSSITTYTIEYTTSQTMVLPIKCVGISARLVGRGGKQGINVTSNVGLYNSGGSGGGSSSVIMNGILPIYHTTSGIAQNLSLTVSTVAGTGFWELLVNGVFLLRSYNGYNGGNATSSIEGIGGISQSAGSGNTQYGMLYSVIKGTAGEMGTLNTSINNYPILPVVGGKPDYIPVFNDSIFGTGNIFTKITGVNNTSSKSWATGVCEITYYIKN